MQVSDWLKAAGEKQKVLLRRYIYRKVESEWHVFSRVIHGEKQWQR